jgi:hypothetical protein
VHVFVAAHEPVLGTSKKSTDARYTAALGMRTFAGREAQAPLGAVK